MKAVTMWMYVSLLMCLAALPLYAQDNDKYDGYLMHKGFGVHFGYVSGNGYSYRYMGENQGIQLVLGGATRSNDDHSFSTHFPASDFPGGPDVIEQVQTGRRYYSNVGLNYMYALKRNKTSLFYLHAGVNWKYDIKHKYIQRYELTSAQPDEYVKTMLIDRYEEKSAFNYGVGPGFEFALSRSVRLAVEIPLTFSNHQIFMYIPQAGIYYYFK